MSSNIVVPVIQTVPSAPINNGLSTANNVHGLIKYCCPNLFQAMFNSFLVKIYRASLKISHLTDTIDNLSLAVNDTYPPQIQGAIKVPQLQFSKDYENSGDRQAWDIAASELIRTTKADHTKKSIDTDIMRESALNVVETHHQHNTSILEKSEIPDFMNTDFAFMKENALTMCQKACTLARHHVIKQIMVKHKQFTLKKNSVTVMTDINILDIRGTVQAEIRKALQSNDSRNKKGIPMSHSQRTLFTSFSQTSKRSEILNQTTTQDEEQEKGAKC
ncbi:hypothetical protein OnM2_085004 [Erysiphe neolycopersici]|uniref:Uncharacterized protein n=1 Tax=Erysiphe neolycopersici TaxID=212602 RepID=A0A420HES9_9PEZI|nr:hypothetical protein OnM2_085004 [Erysiphe neolycopersici]